MLSVTLPGSRRYLLAGSTEAAGLRPAVLVLHGTGGSAAFAADETGWAGTAARHGFVVAFPDGRPADPTRPPSFLTNPQRWNDGSLAPGDLLYALTDDVGYLAAVIDDLVRQHRVDPERVFVTGFSNGAGMTFRFAAERPDLLRAIAPIAGYCPPLPRAAATPVPTLYLVGDADKLIPLHGGTVRLPWGNRSVERPTVLDNLAGWAAVIGCDPTPQVEARTEHETIYQFPGPVRFEFAVVRGLGHHWPGGKGQFNPRIGGPPSDAVDGNERVWNYFRTVC